MATSVYPSGVIQWTPRINCVDIVWANDPNSLANELVAIESTVGVNPQIESNPPYGVGAVAPLGVPGTVAYNTLSARVSDAMNNNLLPFTYLTGNDFYIPGSGGQAFNAYTVTLDPYGMYNGHDITVPCDGFWGLYHTQRFNQLGDNFIGLNMNFLYINGNWVHAQLWDWNNFLGEASGLDIPHPSNVMGSNGIVNFSWMGLLHAGDRLQMLTANYTFCPAILCNAIQWKMICFRTLPSSTTFPSG